MMTVRADMAQMCVPTHFVLGITGPDCFKPSVEGNTPVVNGLPLVANGGPVDIFYDGYATGAVDSLFLNGALLFTNTTTPLGTKISLGNFAPGTILTFDIVVRFGDGTNTYHTGPGSLNPDGDIHSAYAPWTANSDVPESGEWVGIEDGYALGRYDPFPNNDYNDLMFSITNVTPGGLPSPPPPPAQVPEPASALLLGGAVAFLYSQRHHLQRHRLR